MRCRKVRFYGNDDEVKYTDFRSIVEKHVDEEELTHDEKRMLKRDIVEFHTKRCVIEMSFRTRMDYWRLERLEEIFGLALDRKYNKTCMLERLAIGAFRDVQCADNMFL